MKKIILKIYDKKNDRIFFKEFQTEIQSICFWWTKNSIENGYNTRIGGYEGRKYKKDNNRIIRSINIDDEIWKKLQELAKKENRSASNFIEYLIKMWEKNK